MESGTHEVVFSIHYDERGCIVSVTEPPEDLSCLAVLELYGEGPIPLYPKEGVEFQVAQQATVILTKDLAARQCCGWIYVPGYGYVRKCWPC